MNTADVIQIDGVWVPSNLNMVGIRALNEATKKVDRPKDGEKLVHEDALPKMYPSVSVNDIKRGETKKFGELQVKKLTDQIVKVAAM